MSTSDSEKKSDFVRPQIQSLHTLDGDILSSIKNENYASNIVKVLTHDTGKKNESNTGDEEESDIRAQKTSVFPFSFKVNLNSPYFYIGLSVFLLTILGGVAYYVVKTSIEETVPKPDTVATSTASTASSTLPSTIYITQKNIFNAEVVVPIEIEKLTRVQVIDLLESTKKGLVAQEIKNNINVSLSMDVNLQAFFNKIQYSGPDALIRSLVSDELYNFGLYHKQKGDFETYLITQVDVFDLAFSGMLEWEKSISVDVYNIYTYSDINIISKDMPSSSGKNKTGFTDKVIKNIDTRIYTDPVKGTQIIYGFINKKYLLITSGESSFIDIINKLTINNILR